MNASSSESRRLVIKIGSATNDEGLDVAALGLWVDKIAELIGEGVEVVVVSSVQSLKA